MIPAIEEAARLAANLARNCNYHTFPCNEDKRPACPHGFKDASADPTAIEALWRRYPGPLIGIATGERSGVSVVDIDIKHATALDWWRRRERYLPLTRSFRTRGGGVHLYFQHRGGVTCRSGFPVKGIDCRGDLGYIVYWFAAGLECLDHTPPAPWPDWLFAELFPPPAPPAPAPRRQPRPDVRFDAILRRVGEATEGARNAVLYWGSARAAELVRTGELGRGEAAASLGEAARRAGLPPVEAAKTIASGLGERAAP